MEIDVVNKCRVCLGAEEEMHYLYNEFDQEMTLFDILSNTTGFEISKDESFSPYLCQDCTSVVVDFYNLKIIYRENENRLNGVLEENSSPAVEEENETAKRDAIEENTEEEYSVINDEDYITIKVEGVAKSEDEGTERDIDDESNEDESLQYGLTRDEANSFVPCKENASIEFEYQQVTTFTCPECSDCFLNKNDIEEHVNTNHEYLDINYDEISEISLIKVEKKVDTSKCKICNETFQTIANYKEHVEKHKTNICDICGMGFVRKSYLKDHMEVHFPDKKHICGYCNKAFRRRTVLVKHKKIHTHPRQCICEVCGKAFNDKGTLKTHIMLLHLKARNYCCDICGEKFPLKATLEKHVRRHQNKERQFYCSKCPLGYKDKSSLDRHVYAKHSGATVRAQCGECGRFYASSSGLFKHQRICHANAGNSEAVKLESVLE